MTPDPLEIGKLVVLLGGLAGIHLKLQSALRGLAGKGEAREITNNPLNTQAVSRAATMEDVEAVARRVTRLEEQIIVNARTAEDSSHHLLQNISELRDRIDDKLTTVSDRLSEITRAVGRLEGH